MSEEGVEEGMLEEECQRRESRKECWRRDVRGGS